MDTGETILIFHMFNDEGSYLYYAIMANTHLFSIFHDFKHYVCIHYISNIEFKTKTYASVLSSSMNDSHITTVFFSSFITQGPIYGHRYGLVLFFIARKL